jgi:hypothetical protein
MIFNAASINYKVSLPRLDYHSQKADAEILKGKERDCFPFSKL